MHTALLTIPLLYPPYPLTTTPTRSTHRLWRSAQRWEFSSQQCWTHWPCSTAWCHVSPQSSQRHLHNTTTQHHNITTTQHNTHHNNTAAQHNITIQHHNNTQTNTYNY